MNRRLLSKEQFVSLVTFHKAHQSAAPLFDKVLKTIIEQKIYAHGNFYYSADNTPVTNKMWQFNVASLAIDSKEMLVFGFTTGHAVAIALLCNSALKATVIKDDQLAQSCFDIMQEYFGPERLALVDKSAMATLPARFDLVYLDSYPNTPSIVNQNLHRSMLLAAPFAYLLLTDYQLSPIRALWDYYTAAGLLLPKLDVFPFRPSSGSVPIIGVINSTQIGELHHAYVAMTRALVAHKKQKEQKNHSFFDGRYLD